MRPSSPLLPECLSGTVFFCVFGFGKTACTLGCLSGIVLNECVNRMGFIAEKAMASEICSTAAYPAPRCSRGQETFATLEMLGVGPRGGGGQADPGDGL